MKVVNAAASADGWLERWRCGATSQLLRRREESRAQPSNRLGGQEVCVNVCECENVIMFHSVTDRKSVV